MLDDFRDANVTFSMLIYPFGRCMVISPPLQKNLGQFKPNHLYVGFNNTYFNQLNFSFAKLKIFLMDQQKSPKLIPDDMEMVGDQIRIGLERKAFSYRTKISRSEHVTSDPLFDCAVYTQDNSYDDCIRNHLSELFQKQIGCQPPPFADNFDNMCKLLFEHISSPNFGHFLIILAILEWRWSPSPVSTSDRKAGIPAYCVSLSTPCK